MIPSNISDIVILHSSPRPLDALLKLLELNPDDYIVANKDLTMLSYSFVANVNVNDNDDISFSTYQ